MIRACRCGDDGDAWVFGPCRKCTPKPESVHARNLADPAVQERPYEQTLDADERGGR